MQHSYIDNSLHSLAAELGGALVERGWRITTAESCSGGGIAAAITAVAGSSAWFEAGFVTYANRIKVQVLGVDEAVLATEGAVSRVVAEQMARGALAAAGADLAVAVTGIAGPDGGSTDKPVGTVWFAWALASGGCYSHCYVFEGDRAAVRYQTVVRALRGSLETCRHGLISSA
ncbi:MAG TPA: CinA family protein [Cellvibrionaceae bacterium]